MAEKRHLADQFGVIPLHQLDVEKAVKIGADAGEQQNRGEREQDAEAEGERALIVLSQDSREALKLLADYRRALFAAMLFGGLAAAILGFLTARNSLRPLRQMAETASDISASRLDRRLEVTNAPQELKTLAAASTPCGAVRGFVHSLVGFFIGSGPRAAHPHQQPDGAGPGRPVPRPRRRGYRTMVESNLEEYERA